ncbi:hypothetical protein PMIN06_008387 [Paraphaeosphaeria minitans]
MHHKITLTIQNKRKKHRGDDRWRLPNEILMDVFERLLNKPSNLITAMRICKRWHHIASTVLYQHISLDSKIREDTSSARFGKIARQYHLIQSLSVRITEVHLMGFSVHSADAFDRLAELCKAVRKMNNLRTFALSFKESVVHLEGFPVSSAVIVLILQSLPVPSESKKRPNRAVELEYLVIRVIARPECAHLAHTPLCHSGGKLLRGAKLATILQQLYNIGAFPSLCEFAVIGRVDAPSTLQNDNWNVFKIRTFARGISETITLPYCARGGSSSLYMIRDGEGDWFSSFPGISSALEGPLVWTKTGLKATPYLKRYEWNNDWVLDRAKLAPRDSVIKKFGVSFRL